MRRWSALARDYDQTVLSPFLDGVRFPLAGALRRIAHRWHRDRSLDRRVAIDLGCGTGSALPLLAQHFSLVVGIDFAPGMLAASLQRVRQFRHDAMVLRDDAARGAAREITNWTGSRQRKILLARANLQHLRPLEQTADIALAINSLVTVTDRGRTLFHALARVMRPGGVAILVLPALDGLAYLLQLHRRYGYTPAPIESVNWQRGLVQDGSGFIQKYFLADEIRDHLTAHGFRLTRIEPLRCPWAVVGASGWGFFPRHPRIWDWYVEAIRSPMR